MPLATQVEEPRQPNRPLLIVNGKSQKRWAPHQAAGSALGDVQVRVPARDPVRWVGVQPRPPPLAHSALP